MTHPMQTTALDQITELPAEQGFDGLASAVTVPLNEVMKIERAHALGAQGRSVLQDAQAGEQVSDAGGIAAQRRGDVGHVGEPGSTPGNRDAGEMTCKARVHRASRRA